MTTNEEYGRWVPLENIPLRLVCESIHDGDKGLSMVFREQADLGKISKNQNTRSIRIIFDPAIAYRNIDESYRVRTFDTHQDRIGSLFVVKNSEWVSWLHEESYGMYVDNKIIHYAIFTLNDCIDILAEFEPTVEWINP
jgi:hypothetical protein